LNQLPTIMKILVAGGSGKTGRHIIELLQEDDHEVACIVRDRAMIAEMEKLGVKALLANLEMDVEFAVEGVEAVIFAATSGATPGSNKNYLVDRDGAIKLINACEKNAVERFILLSDKRTGKPDSSDGLRDYLLAKKEAEARLQKSRLNYTIVRAGRLNDDRERGSVTAAVDLGRSYGEISRADVARVIVSALDKPSTYRKAIEVIGGDQPIEEALKRV